MRMGSVAKLKMDLSYLLTPFIAWLAAGCLKFLINSIRAKKLAFGLIGYGGLPSNHSAIVSSMAALIALKEGIGHPVFGLAVTLAFIVMLDASSLRKQVGTQATAINRLTKTLTPRPADLRERMGHTPIEILAGAITGVCVAYFTASIQFA
jgi:acid phosphatase family membrane protein YuiD